MSVNPGCTECINLMELPAATIVGLGWVEVASLGPEAELVVEIAEMLGVAPIAVLAAIQKLGAQFFTREAIPNIAQYLCQIAGRC